MDPEAAIEDFDATRFSTEALEIEETLEDEKRQLQDETNRILRKREEEQKVAERATTKARVAQMTKSIKGPSQAEITAQRKAQEKYEKEMEAAEIKAIQWKISKYLERFPGIGPRIPKLSAKPSLGECQQVLEIVREMMMTRNSEKAIEGYIGTGFSLIDMFWGDGSKMTALPSELRLNLKGCSSLFRNGSFPELDPLIAEIDIEYPWIGRRPLGMRIFSAFSEVLLKVHMLNTNPAARKAFEMSQSQAVVDDGEAGL